MSFEGACRLEGECFRGWAREISNHRPLWVELCGEGMSLGIALADQREPNGCGFSLVIPPAALDFSDNLEVRVANSDFILPREDDSGRGQPTLQGELFVDRGLTLISKGRR